MTAAVEARNLGKLYKRYARPANRLLEWMTLGRACLHHSRWVLRRVDLAVNPGECLGVIGQNGSGKSTLLKLLAGVTDPTEGQIETRGRVSALLELGLGFHPDFTGRQNAALSLRLQGCDGAESALHLPGVEAFAEVGDYFDQPVRTYSSGMQVRLAFACATAVRPEVLLVDEALAVGDAYFQHKCYARVREFLDAGTALLFVSHDPTSVRTLCTRALLLDSGVPVLQGAPDEVLDYYNALIARKEADAAIRKAETERGVATVRSGNGRILLQSVDLLDAGGKATRAFLSGDPARLKVALRAEEELPFPTVGFLIRDPKGNDVYGTNTHHLRLKGPSLAPGESVDCMFDFPVELGPGEYTITAALHTQDTHVECNYDWWDKVIGFQVVPGGRPYSVGTASLRVQAGLSGVVNSPLPGEARHNG